MNNSSLSPIFGYIPQPTMLDFRGHLAITFFTSGCNFRCRFCHNRTILAESSDGISWDKLAEICSHFKEDWIDGVVITGGEPTLSPNLKKLIEFFKTYNLKIKLDTNGSHPDLMQELIPLLDYIAVDIKCPLPDYHDLVEFNDLKSIKKTINILMTDIIQYEFRTTIIEDYHTKERLLAMRDLIEGAARYVLQPFVPRDTVLDKTLRNTPRTSDKYLKVCQEIFTGHVQDLIVL